MSPDEFSKIKKQLDDALQKALTKQDWAKALGISIATFHRYLDPKAKAEVPDDKGRLMEALLKVIQETQLPPRTIVEAIKATGVAGVVARAASAGILPVSMVALLASMPTLLWMGALGGAVGGIIGAGALAFFNKITPEEPKK